MESTTDILEDEMSRAIGFEKSNKPKEATKAYEALLKQHPLNEKILSRLIINYRKIKDYKKELKHINALLKVHEGFYVPQRKKQAVVISISQKINKSLGATDKKGNKIYSDDTITKLQKRKTLVEKKYAESQAE